MKLSILRAGFPVELDRFFSSIGDVIETDERFRSASISEWLSQCEVRRLPSQGRTGAANGVDLLVIYAHARLTANAFRQDCQGVELLKHLRTSTTERLGDLRTCHVVVVSWASAEEIVKRNPGNTILFSSGVSFARLPDAIAILSNSDELKKRGEEKADLDDPRLRASIRADYDPPDSAHQMSNWWGAWRLIQAIEGIDAKMPTPVRQKISLLSTKQALFLDRRTDPDNKHGLPRMSIDRLQRLVGRSKPRICYVDDEADQGWEQAFKSLLYGQGDCSGFRSINPQRSRAVRDLSELAKEVLDNAPNLLILDLRLAGNSESSKPPKETTGALLLGEIRRHNKGLPVLLMTASNKARTLQDLFQLGADAFWMKEGIGEHAPLYAVENPAIELIRLLESLLGENWQFLLRFQKAQQELRSAFEEGQCWWSHRKKWKPVEWLPNVWAPEETNLSQVDIDRVFAILSETAIFYREYLSQDLFSYYGELRTPASRDLWLRGITMHAARLIEAVHRFDEVETFIETYRAQVNDKAPTTISGLIKKRGDALGQEIYNQRNAAAHYKPTVMFTESNTSDLLGILSAWLCLDPSAYSVRFPGRARPEDNFRTSLGRDSNFEKSLIEQLRKMMFVDPPLPDESRCAQLLASAELPEIRLKEGKRIGADALGRVVELESGQRAALALQYLQPFAEDARTKVVLQKRWRDGNTPSPLKCHLIWRIGDDRGLDTRFKAQMRSWIFDNFGEWSLSAQNFFGATPQKILDAIQKKLDVGSEYPEHKKWILICCVPISCHEEDSRHLLTSLSSADQFVEATRIAVLERFYPESNDLGQETSESDPEKIAISENDPESPS